MTTTIPVIEPTQIRSGDTIKWNKTLLDYPADDSWILTYKLINQTDNIDITAVADGALHTIVLLAATTAVYKAGAYTWIGHVTKTTERYSIGKGGILILPDLAAVSSDGVDLRTSAQQVLDKLNEAMRVHGSNAFTQAYSIAGRQMSFRSLSEFMAYRSKVQAEVNAEKFLTGGKPENKINVRFI